MFLKGLPESSDLTQFVPPDGLLRSRSTARTAAHSKSTSNIHLPTNALPSNSHFPQSSSTSPRLHAGPVSATRAGGLEAESPYGHHRQTSIVHGYQHSRNGSVASTSSSPLSPQIIAAAGGFGAGGLESAPGMAESPAFSASTSTLVPDRVSTAAENSAQKRVERMHSGKSRREHSRHHSHSHSRHHHKEERKTVGEYALHVLFTSVSRPTLPTNSC